MNNAPFVLNVHKPVGMTSAAVVGFFKRRFPRKVFGKIGHFGTLDPFAEGVLLLGFSGATRLAPWLHRLAPKSYRARGILGARTDSGDSTGEVVERRELAPISPGELSALAASRPGEYLQRPPHFSASKHQGRPLHRYAREGVFIDKPPVLRHIHDFRELLYAAPELSFSCRVSSGTYIRTLFEDVARALGQIGHLTELIRTGIGAHSLADSLPRDQWERPPQELLSRALSLPETLPLPVHVLEASRAKSYRDGAPCPGSGAPELCWVHAAEKNVIGLGRREGEFLRPCFNFPRP